MGEGVSRGIGGRLQGWRARTQSAEWSKEDAKKGFESHEKAKKWKLGQIRTQCVRNSYKFHILVNM